MDLDFDRDFEILSKALFFNGTHPYLKRDTKWLLKTFVPFLIYSFLFYLLIYTLIYQDLKSNNFTQICKNGMLAILFILVSMQFFVLLYNQKALLNLITCVKNDYNLFKSLKFDEQIIVQKYAAQGLYVCKLWKLIAIAVFLGFNLKYICLMFYTYYTDEFKWINAYEFMYPNIIENNKNNMFVYWLIIVYLNWASFYGSVMHVAYVPLGPVMILHACGQLEIVRNRINNLFVCEEINEDMIKEKFSFIVQHLQYVHRFLNIIMDVFKVSYDVTLKASTVLVPVTIYGALEALNQGDFSIDFVSFVIGSLIVCTSSCYYSQLLMEKGEAVRMSIYSCGWELHYDRRTRTTLQILLLYGLRPVAIRTIFRTLCLEALTDIFQQSYAIFNFMNAMWK